MDIQTFLTQDDLFVAGSAQDEAYVASSGVLRYTLYPVTCPLDDMETTVVRDGSWLREPALWSEASILGVRNYGYFIT